MSFVDSLRIRMVGRSIRRNLPKGKDLIALDLGCGYQATFLRMIQSSLAKGVGVDVSISAECDVLPRLEFVRTSIDSALLTLPTEFFDLILLISVLEHLQAPMEALMACKRLLKRSGLLMINVPTWFAKPVLEVLAFRLGMSPAYEMDDHKMYCGKRDLWPLLIAAGFRPSRIKLRYQSWGMVLFGLVTK